MKKVIIWMAVCILSLSFSACGQSTAPAVEKPAEKETEEIVQNCDTLGHAEGPWEKTDTDYIKAEQHYEKKCTRCGEVIDRKTEGLDTMRDGKNFTLTPADFIARVDACLKRMLGSSVSAMEGTAQSHYACVFVSEGTTVGYLNFLERNSSGETEYPGADGTFGGLFGQCLDPDMSGAYVLACVEALHPDLSDEEAAEIAKQIAENVDTGIDVTHDNVKYSGYIGDSILVFVAVIPQLD